jgi:hypothetical protein
MMRIASPATIHSVVPMAIGKKAVSFVRRMTATYSTNMSAGARRIVTLVVLVSLIGAVVLAALAGVVFV